MKTFNIILAGMLALSLSGCSSGDSSPRVEAQNSSLENSRTTQSLEQTPEDPTSGAGEKALETAKSYLQSGAPGYSQEYGYISAR